jgi:hypothetical protein
MCNLGRAGRPPQQPHDGDRATGLTLAPRGAKAATPAAA